MLGHDSKYHIETIIGLEHGNLLEFLNQKIIPDFASNYGYGAGIFYPQAPHYLAAVIYHFLKIFGLGPTAAIKIVYFFAVFFSGFFMYRFLRHNFRRRTPALLAAIIYMTAPYLVSDILVRDSMNEVFVFVFIPLVLSGFQSLIEKRYRRFLILFSIGYIGLVNTHLVLTMYFTIFLAVSALFFVKDLLNWRAVRYTVASIAIVVLSSAFFLVPILQHKNATEYAVSNGVMYTSTEVANRAMSLSDHISGRFLGDPEEAAVVLFSSVFAIALSAFAVFNYKRFIKSQKTKLVFVFGVVFCVLSVFVSSGLMPWTKLPEFLSAIQFPWRMVTFLTIGLTLLSGLTLYNLKAKADGVLSILCVTCCMLYVAYIQGTGIIILDRYNTTELPALTDRYMDYYPVKFCDNIDENFRITRPYEIVVTSGTAAISDVVSMPTEYSFRVSNVKDSVTVEIPKLYYLGYDISVTADSQTERISYSESEDGLIEFTLDKDAEVSVHYVNTRAGQISNVVSGLTLVGFGAYIVASRKSK